MSGRVEGVRYDFIARVGRRWVRLKLWWMAAVFRARGDIWTAHRVDVLREKIRAYDEPNGPSRQVGQ